MKRRNFLAWLGVGTVVISLPLLFGNLTEKAFGITPNKTDLSSLDILQAAYNDSANSHTRYLAFAKVAQQENYLEAAELFRAAALGEQIHRDNHARIIQQLGSQPEFHPVILQEGTTLENLRSTIAIAAQEQDSYSSLLQQAKVLGNTAVITTLEEAREGKASRESLYQEVKFHLQQANQGWLHGEANIEVGRTDEAIASKADSVSGARVKSTFYVCSVCGYTTRNLPETCPQCGVDQDKFQEFQR